MGWSGVMHPISGAVFERQQDFVDICLHTEVAVRMGTTETEFMAGANIGTNMTFVCDFSSGFTF